MGKIAALALGFWSLVGMPMLCIAGDLCHPCVAAGHRGCGDSGCSEDDHHGCDDDPCSAPVLARPGGVRQTLHLEWAPLHGLLFHLSTVDQEPGLCGMARVLSDFEGLRITASSWMFPLLI